MSADSLAGRCLAIIATLVICSLLAGEPDGAQPTRLLVFGNSLTSGYKLPQGTAFPDVLARRLHADGYGNVLVYNGSEAGETTAEALQRFPSAKRLDGATRTEAARIGGQWLGLRPAVGAIIPVPLTRRTQLLEAILPAASRDPASGQPK
jgi:hypothetical protein